MENTPKSSRSLIGQVVENLGAHGIPNIKRAKNTHRKFFWFVIVIFGFTAFSLHCYMIIDQYLQYEVTVNLDIRYEPRLAFPAVSICNLNPVKESALQHYHDLDSLLGPPPMNEWNLPMTGQPMTTTSSSAASSDQVGFCNKPFFLNGLAMLCVQVKGVIH